MGIDGNYRRNPFGTLVPLLVFDNTHPRLTARARRILERLPTTAGSPIQVGFVEDLSAHGHGPIHAGSLLRERRILFETTGAEETQAKVSMNAEILITAQRLVRRLPVGDSVVEAILSLVRSARPGPEGGEAGKLIAWGPGPRASQSLMLAVRARALLDGRLAPSIDDVLDLAEPVLKHRMALTFSARAEGRTIPDVIKQLKARIG